MLRSYGVKLVVSRTDAAYDSLAEGLAVANAAMNDGIYFTHSNRVAKAIGFATTPKLICVCSILFLAASGCRQNTLTTNSKPSKSFAYVHSAAQRGKIVYNVKYQPQTVVFDEPATERAFRRVSLDGATYVLVESEPAVRELKPGSVLFLYGVALRKVTAVHTQGSYAVVSTTQAELTDAIRDGEITWQVPIDFSQGASQAFPRKAAASLFDFVSPTVWAAAPEPPGVHFEGSILDFDFDVGFVPEGKDRLKLDIGLKTSKLNGAVIQLNGDGYVQNLTSIGKISISGGSVKEADFATEGFNGKVEFTWTAQQQNIPGVSAVLRETKIHIPGASWEYPLVLGGLPFIFELSASIIVHPALTSQGSFSTGEFTISYSGSEGFKSSEGGTSGEGAVENTQEIKHDTSIFGIGPAGFVAALELPRAELALGIMSPSRLAEHDASGSYDLIAGLAPGGMDFKYTKIAQLGELIEELALPVKPFAYFDVVTSASMVTSGMTGTMPLPGAVLQVPCENAHLVVAANVGVGAKIGFPLPHSVTSALGPVVPHQATFEPFEAAMNIYKKETVAYKNGKKCLGDP